MSAEVSIILIPDYQPGQDKAWGDLRKTVKGLAEQDYDGEAEFVLVEERRFANSIPSDLFETLPSLRVLFIDTEMSSYEMKNFGAEECKSELVVILDGDCAPAPGWLSAFMRAMRDNPNASVVSGRTRYPGETFFSRAMGLLSRVYVDRGVAGPTDHISNNNAGFRRSAYLEHPLPIDAGVFAAGLQTINMQAADALLYFEPNMAVIHDYPGWAFESDARRYMGWGAIVSRLKDRRMPRAWLTNLSYLSIPVLFVGHILKSWWRAALYHRHYGVQTWQLPGVFGLAVLSHALEVPGMVAAYRGRGVGVTDYR